MPAPPYDRTRRRSHALVAAKRTCARGKPLALLATATAARHHRCITSTPSGGPGGVTHFEGRRLSRTTRLDDVWDEESGSEACYGKVDLQGFSISRWLPQKRDCVHGLAARCRRFSRPTDREGLAPRAPLRNDGRSSARRELLEALPKSGGADDDSVRTATRRSSCQGARL